MELLILAFHFLEQIERADWGAIVFGSWFDVISNYRPRLPKTRSCNTSSATLRGRRKSRFKQIQNVLRPNPSNKSIPLALSPILEAGVKELEILVHSLAGGGGRWQCITGHLLPLLHQVALTVLKYAFTSWVARGTMGVNCLSLECRPCCVRAWSLPYKLGWDQIYSSYTWPDCYQHQKGLISMWTFQDVSVSSDTIVTGKGSNWWNCGHENFKVLKLCAHWKTGRKFTRTFFTPLAISVSFSKVMALILAGNIPYTGRVIAQ